MVFFFFSLPNKLFTIYVCFSVSQFLEWLSQQHFAKTTFFFVKACEKKKLKLGIFWLLGEILCYYYS